MKKTLEATKRQSEGEIKKTSPIKFKRAKLDNLEPLRKFSACVVPISSIPSVTSNSGHNFALYNYEFNPSLKSPTPISQTKPTTNYSQKYNNSASNCPEAYNLPSFAPSNQDLKFFSYPNQSRPQSRPSDDYNFEPNCREVYNTFETDHHQAYNTPSTLTPSMNQA